MGIPIEEPGGTSIVGGVPIIVSPTISIGKFAPNGSKFGEKQTLDPSSLDKVDDEEVGYAQRLTALEKFLSVVILEYNYKVESNDD